MENIRALLRCLYSKIMNRCYDDTRQFTRARKREKEKRNMKFISSAYRVTSHSIFLVPRNQTPPIRTIAII